MQFSCESCKAQLQIADEKVRGKRLVVRCKRCGAKIALADPLLSKSPPRVIAPGPAPSPRVASVPDSDTESTRAMDSDVLERALRASRREDAIQNGSPPTQRFAAPPPAVPPDPAVWFAMLHGKQTGPMTRTELETHADEGDLGPRTYVWCEGMDAWQRARDVIELVALFPQLPGPTPPPMAPAPARSQPSPSRAQALAAAEARASFGTTDPGATAPGADTQPHAHSIDEGKAPAPGHGAAAEQAPPKEATPKPATQILPRAVMFGNAVRHGQGPFIVFLGLMALAVAAIVLWIVLGAAPQKPAEPRSEAESAARAGTRVQTAARTTEPAPPVTAFVGLTADQVRRKLDENKPALQDCVDDARRRDPDLQVGTIRVATTIAPSGQVTEARIDRQAVDESPLGACLKHATRKIVFPQFSGAAFDVEIPISVGAAH
jgi:predicted Zn finger-like uncharacterized protein